MQVRTHVLHVFRIPPFARAAVERTVRTAATFLFDRNRFSPTAQPSWQPPVIDRRFLSVASPSIPATIDAPMHAIFNARIPARCGSWGNDSAVAVDIYSRLRNEVIHAGNGHGVSGGRIRDVPGRHPSAISGPGNIAPG